MRRSLESTIRARKRPKQFLSSLRGHRAVWAAFNLALQAAAKDKGLLMHKTTDRTVLTKQHLQEFASKRKDLVHALTTFGSDIPTTSMHWRKQASNLEWIVRHMSWAPPWTESAPDHDVPQPDRLSSAVSRIPNSRSASISRAPRQAIV